MSVIRNEAFDKRVEEKKEELYQKLYKEKFTQVYMITYSTCGDGEEAERVAEEEAWDYAEHMIQMMENEIIEDVEEEMYQ